MLFNIFITADEINNSKSNPQYLEQGNWRERSWGEISLRFSLNKKGTAMFQYVINYEDDMPWTSGLGYVDYHGISMSFRSIPGNDYSKMPDDFFSQTAQVMTTTSDLFYSEYLLLKPKGLKLWNLHVQVEEGEIRKVENTAIVMINRHGTANENVSVRSGPGTQYNRSKLPLYNNQTFYPSGSRVFVYGRTEEKQVIEDWNAYWYLIHIPVHVMSSYTNPNGVKKWVYGEFIDIDVK